METQRHRGLYKAAAAPAWKEAYRRRCLERLKSSRAQLLARYRRAGEHGRGRARGALLAREVMEEEWQALRSAGTGGKEALSQMLEDPDELAVLEEIQQELIFQEQLTIEEYEQSLQFDEKCLNAMLDGLDAGSKVICPVCKSCLCPGTHFCPVSRNDLTVMSHLVLCQCGLHICTKGMTEQKLRSLLEDSLTEHGHRCLHNPEFSITSGMEEEASLLMSCPKA
ncbi:RPA-interacting protein isoform X2 [Alligator mississippiensis]|uniref:RPA-interacting protein isoform X2 n=1 Tax=Alligator mississippiensis TaxID=8496 RepID=UPI0009075691|nr:RPA-interacting protein isoform X2 [Alligator mississippiensis]